MLGFKYDRHRMTEGPVFKVEFWRGDDQWRPSLHIEHWWFGRHIFHLIWLPG